MIFSFGVFRVLRVFRGQSPMADVRKIDEVGSDNRLLYSDEAYAVIGAAMEVYYRLGSGFAEPVYQESLGLEFGLRSIPFVAQTKLRLKYKDFVLKKFYRADFICFDKIIVEIKAESALTGSDWGQVMNYMKASGFRVGLLFNFGSIKTLEKKRIII